MITIQMLNAHTANSLASLQGSVTTPPVQRVPVAGLAEGVEVEPAGLFRCAASGSISFENYGTGGLCLLDPGSGVWCDGPSPAEGVPAAYAYTDRAGHAYIQTARGWMMFNPIAGWVRAV